VIGSASLSDISPGWLCSAQIPAGTADGTYNLIARLAGEFLASTSIIVANVLKPLLTLIDPPPPLPLAGGMVITVGGAGFPDGPVTLSLSGGISTGATASSGQFTANLTLPGNVNTGALPYTLTAIGVGGVSATLSFTTIGPPK
jgi:hypothetical protein